ncbi:hypothetical protein H8D57_03760, partial [bacterium]|nr:hypothetical protein [bacterium]
MRLFLTNVYKFWGILSICFVMNSVAVAQDDARLEFFEGGRIDGSLILRSTLLSGPGVFASIGGTTAPYAPEPFIVFGNPAALGRINNNQFVLGFSPQIELEVTDFTDPTATVNTEIDAGLDSFEKTGPIGYPEFTFQVGRAGSAVDGLAACFMVDQSKDKWFGKIPRLLDRFAFGYNKPLIINSEFVYSGLRMRIRTIDETPESELLFFSSIKMNSSLKVTSDAWALSGARQLGKFWVGVGATRTDIGIQLTSAYLSDGILSMAGNESSFGDPRSAWAEDKSNEFSGNAYGRLDGTSWGTRVGLTYQPAEWVLLGADIRLQTKVQMEGPLDFELHRFTAMRFNADEGDSKFDVNKVNPAELTRTLAKLFEMPSNMEIEIPSAFSFGVTFLVPTNPSINFTKYSGELS